MSSQPSTVYVRSEYIIFDFENIKFCPTRYMLKNCNDQKFIQHTLKSWNLSVSNDGYNWIILDKHVNDMSLIEKGINSSISWQIKCKKYFRYIRIHNTGRMYVKFYVFICIFCKSVN